MIFDILDLKMQKAGKYQLFKFNPLKSSFQYLSLIHLAQNIFTAYLDSRREYLQIFHIWI